MKTNITRFWILLALGMTTPALAQTLTIDPAWSEITFNVSNFGIHTVYGRFDRYSGKIEFNSQSPEQSKVHVVIQAGSINTQNVKRDNHLQTSDFFDVAKYPELTFESQTVDRKDGGYQMTGLLTIKGKSLPVTIPFTFTTTAANGKTILHAQGKSKVNRHDFGIDYGSNFSVGKLISIHLSVAASE
jgi:polyisoprenoid-binding protein YceI